MKQTDDEMILTAMNNVSEYAHITELFDSLEIEIMYELIGLAQKAATKPLETEASDICHSISVSLPSATSPEFKKWLDENGYKKEPVDFLVRKGDTAYSVHHLYQHYTNVLLFGNKR